MYSSPVIAQNFQTLLSVNGKYSINQSSESLNLIQPTSGVQLEAFGNINSASSYLVTSTSYGGLDVSADVATLVLSG